ncbi:anti-phage deoxyguanosine triphosphatase [Thiomicrospira sp. R3]|uniref:anti-phage deoxyguanosine triphosphatase n=1 Tax=Thiomicrospira sp. R3 TaxID=3035472 RepID=UPI00259B92A4|nr:anti-phage deoxyguanosine triphosphatase [Thiomicrospira sp. R3]WFE68137.1 anti-phage deoxyguanosine triphosphatase [Thiomicrospira sp. R3]
MNAIEQESIWTQKYTEYLHNSAARPARIVYQRDRARVIHSASFRRLQSKTQIFGLNESDFFRTRLTHSMEVAQIGSGMVEQLITDGDNQAYLDWLPSFYLIEAICLAHDLGHPPFGHGGEVALNYMMRHHGGFEGNAQTLRILSKLGEYTPDNGIDLSRRATLGVLKYPAIYDDVIKLNSAYLTQLEEPDVTDFKTWNMQAWYPPKSIYKEEQIIFDWVLAPFSAKDRALFTALDQSDVKHHVKTCYKGFDTTIMELADDIAYGIHDLEDAVAMKMVTRDLWQAEVMDNTLFKTYGLWDNLMTERLFSGSSKSRKHAVSKMVGLMVEHVYVAENSDFNHPLLRYQACLPEAQGVVLDLLKQFVFKNVITIPEVKGMEYKGQLIVMELFKALDANAERLLPSNTLKKVKKAQSERERKRVICDYIAGMTNTYASRLYEKFFMPKSGSIFDRL